MNSSDIEKYRDYLEGSGGKRMYYFNTISFSDWVIKYFEFPDLTGWNSFMVWTEEAFKRSEKFEKEWCKGRNSPYNFELLNLVYEKLSNLKYFDDDVNKYIAFIMGEGFLDQYKLKFEDWLFSNNWHNPYKKCLSEDKCFPLVELAKMQYGMNYIRVELANINFWKFR